ncbi:MAG: hypothetical protein WCC17_09725 [Candidatus Nitrosopolaris sp.]
MYLCLYTGEPYSTIEGLKQALAKAGEFDEESIAKYIRLFADVWRNLEHMPSDRQDWMCKQSECT